MKTRTFRPLALGAIVVATGCVARPDSDPEWNRLANDTSGARPYALDRADKARSRAKIGRLSGLLALGGAAVCAYVTAWYHDLDTRDHWTAPWGTWAAFTGVGVSVGIGSWVWAGNQSGVADDWENALANLGKAPAAPAEKPAEPVRREQPRRKPLKPVEPEKPAEPPADVTPPPEPPADKPADVPPSDKPPEPPTPPDEPPTPPGA